MKILALNGSPKGNYSITLQSVLYIQKHFEDDNFEIINAAQKIKKFEKDFSLIISAVKNADILLFAYPVYTYMAPYQLHRFIELLKEQSIDLCNKFAAQITTSKHFFDVTAHKYIEQNCADLGLKYIYGLSADADDLLTEKGQKDALNFWKYVRFCVENDIYAPAKKQHDASPPPYFASFSASPSGKLDGYDTVIITNSSNDESLDNIITDFKNLYPYKTRVINVADYPFSGGCLGCLSCSVDGKCIQKDGFDIFWRENIQGADAIVYAFSIRDHSMGASFKIYYDRQFYNGHRCVTAGLPVCYLVNGDLESEPNLKIVIEGKSEVGHNFLCGIATDANELKKMSQKLVYALQNRMPSVQNFYGVGGRKIFRDLVYLLRGLMKADHRFYKNNGLYDFPQKRKSYSLKMMLVGLFITIPSVKKMVGSKMRESIISSYKKVIENN